MRTLLKRIPAGSTKNMMKDELGEKEQNELARYYNTQIWAIPSIFFALVGVMFQALDWRLCAGLWNLIILGVTFIFSFVLLLLFNKTHFQQLRLQNYIKKNEKEEGVDNPYKRSSWFSLEAGEVEAEAKRLREEEKERIKKEGGVVKFKISWWQENLAKISTVKWVRRAMYLTIVSNTAAIAYILIKLLRL